MTIENTDNRSMSRSGFEQMCRDASIELGLNDTAALGSGHSVVFDEVLLDLQRLGASDRFVLLAEMGPADADHKAEIYEHLFLMQMLSWAQPGLRFGFNLEREALVMCLEAGCGPGANGAWFARLIRAMAAQVTRLRSTLLAGDVGPLGSGDSENPFQAAAEKFVAVYESSLAAAAPEQEQMTTNRAQA